MSEVRVECSTWGRTFDIDRLRMRQRQLARLRTRAYGDPGSPDAREGALADVVWEMKKALTRWGIRYAQRHGMLLAADGVRTVVEPMGLGEYRAGVRMDVWKVPQEMPDEIKASLAQTFADFRGIVFDARDWPG